MNRMKHLVLFLLMLVSLGLVFQGTASADEHGFYLFLHRDHYLEAYHSQEAWSSPRYNSSGDSVVVKPLNFAESDSLRLAVLADSLIHSNQDVLSPAEARQRVSTWGEHP